jgi:tetratricopeptide (TPR) repeat protein
VHAARALAAAGQWGESAAVYVEIAALPGLSRSASQHALAAAGDALRRDDRPAAAAKQLAAAVRLDPTGEASGMLRVQLAGVLQQAGQLDVAVDMAREGLSQAVGLIEQTIARDTLIGSLIALGWLDEAGVLLDVLAETAPKTMLAAVWFRQGTRLRMAGDLLGADARYVRSAETMMEHPGAAAAAIMGRAETALFAGQPEQAIAHYTHAGQLWTAAGRRAGLYRAEAGLIRAMLSAGQVALSAGIVRPIAYARQRQLPLLLAHLLLARGAAEGSDHDLSEAVALAERAGAVFLEGRARLIRSQRGGRYGDGARVAHLLAPDVAWMAVLNSGAPMPW